MVCWTPTDSVSDTSPPHSHPSVLLPAAICHHLPGPPPSTTLSSHLALFSPKMSSTTTSALWTEASDKKVQLALRTWTQELEQKGKDAIQLRLPQKILDINQVLENFSDASLPAFEPIPGSPVVEEQEAPAPASAGRKKRKVPNGKDAPASTIDSAGLAPGAVKNAAHVGANARVNAHYIFLRQHWEELISITNDIKIHINLLVPKIEDGDTFGVQVQEECLSELARAQDSGYNLLEAQFKHHMSRAKLASKLIKYPNVEDYQMAMQEHDRRATFLCKQHLLDLRNIYTLLTDLLHKNIAKVTKPKGANSDGMY